jgi:hypothetical protein
MYYRILISVWFWICFLGQEVFACRYNVRETGFVEQSSESYYFYGYIDKDTPDEITSAFNEILFISLINCNIQPEIINIDVNKDHPALKYLSLWNIKSYPAAILVSPEGKSMVVSLKNENESFEKTLKSALKNIVSSPVREKIIKSVIENYGVILLIESGNKMENEKYRKISLAAIENIKFRMKTMVKKIEYPPVLISVKPESFSDEKILFWSLGLEGEITEPYAAVFYGRARWIGSLMRGEEISETNLTNILSIIGEDCECDLNISWVSGTMLPLNWNQERQSEVAKLLKFDPENPMVKIEVNRILRKGSSSYPNVPFTFPDSVSKSDLISEGYVVDEKEHPLKFVIYFIVGFIILIIVTAIILILKQKRKYKKRSKSVI